MKPWKAAAARAVVGATVLGAVNFFAIWSQTDELKLLLIAFATPFFGTIATRGVAEGWLDTNKPPLP